MNRTIVIITGVIILLIATVGSIVLSKVSDSGSREYIITIPDGTGAQIEAGRDPGVIPAEIRLTLGEQDILVIHNDDSVGHQISDLWVGAGETVRQQFKTPAVYKGICTVHKTSQIQIIVSE